MDPVEIGATAAGLASVVLTVRQSVWCWPTGLLMVALYAFVFFEARLYSDMGLQIVYVFVQIYGWWNWLRRNDSHERIQIRRIHRDELLLSVAVFLICTAFIGFTTGRYTDAALPYIDAAQATASLLATWLLARKVVENWWIWIAVDIVSVGMYLSRELALTAGLYGVFLVLATIGGVTWWRRIEPGERAWSWASSSRRTQATATSSTSRGPTSPT